MSAKENITVWIYAGKGVSELSLRSAITTFKQKLTSPHIHSVQRITSADILADRLNGNGCLVMPGGADLPYTEQLNGRGNERIKEFVAQGNLYIGICAGGYYGARDIAFHGEGYRIHGARELAFFPGTAIGSIASLTQGQLYDESTASKAIVTLSFTDTLSDQFYYHGGPYFHGKEDSTFHTIARYPDGNCAIVSGDYARGKYLLSGVHFELCATLYSQHAVQNTQANNQSHDQDKEQRLHALLKRPHYGQAVFDEINIIMKSLFA